MERNGTFQAEGAGALGESKQPGRWAGGQEGLGEARDTGSQGAGHAGAPSRLVCTVGCTVPPGWGGGMRKGPHAGPCQDAEGWTQTGGWDRGEVTRGPVRRATELGPCLPRGCWELVKSASLPSDGRDLAVGRPGPWGARPQPGTTVRLTPAQSSQQRPGKPPTHVSLTLVFPSEVPGEPRGRAG